MARNDSSDLHGFIVGVERQGGIVFAESLLIGVRRVFFLEVARVREHELRQIHGGGRSIDLPFESVFHQTRDIARVIEVSVCQDQPLNA